MRFPVLFCIIALGAISTKVHATTEPVQQTSRFVFYSGFWLNLHHTLYAAAWARRPHTTARPQAEAFPEALDEGALTTKERAAWEVAIAYYDRELADRDLAFDDEMTAIRKILTVAQAKLPDVGLPTNFHDVLVKAAPVYRRYWWRMHDHANRTWIADVAPRLKLLAPEVVPRLTKLMLMPWFIQPVRVDVVRVGKSGGAYTVIDPDVHITISTGDPNGQQWEGVETLFHEASHALIHPIQDRIDAEAKATGKQTGPLWHVVLFWTVGEIVREALEHQNVSYTQYIYATGLLQRAWPQFRRPIEVEWAPYVEGKISIDQAVKRLVAAV